MNQPLLPFGTKPLAHTLGPDTAKKAIERHTMTGRRETHNDYVYNLVRTYPGRTSRELCAAQADEVVDLTELRRRLTDLKNRGSIVVGESRACRIVGTVAQTWMIEGGR